MEKKALLVLFDSIWLDRVITRAAIQPARGENHHDINLRAGPGVWPEEQPPRALTLWPHDLIGMHVCHSTVKKIDMKNKKSQRRKRDGLTKLLIASARKQKRRIPHASIVNSGSLHRSSCLQPPSTDSPLRCVSHCRRSLPSRGAERQAATQSLMSGLRETVTMSSSSCTYSSIPNFSVLST